MRVVVTAAGLRLEAQAQWQPNDNATGDMTPPIRVRMANRQNVDRLKPQLAKRNVIEARGLSLRSAAAASMTDQELDTALAENWTEGLGWEVTRRQKIAFLAELRANEPADDMDTAESEVSRGA